MAHVGLAHEVVLDASTLELGRDGQQLGLAVDGQNDHPDGDTRGRGRLEALAGRVGELGCYVAQREVVSND